AQNGIDAKTLKARVRADLSWQYIIRGKFQSSLQVSEKSVLDQIATEKKGDGGDDVGYDYTLRPILFVVPRGNTALQESRRKDAVMSASRFTGSNAGFAVASFAARCRRPRADHQELLRSGARPAANP